MAAGGVEYSHAFGNLTAAVVKVDVGNPADDMQGLWSLGGRIDRPFVAPSQVAVEASHDPDLSGNSFLGTAIPGFVGSFKAFRYLDLICQGTT